MKIEIGKCVSDQLKSDILVLFVTPKFIKPGKMKTTDLPTNIISDLKSILAYHDFKAKQNEILTSYLPDNLTKRILLIGTGESGIFKADELRNATSVVYHELKKINGKKAHIIFNQMNLNLEDIIVAVTETLLLANYSFGWYKKEKDKEQFSIEKIIYLLSTHDYQPSAQDIINKTVTTVEGVNLARTLVNKPGNILTPKVFAKEVENQFKEIPSIRVEVFSEKKIQSLKMGAFLSVARGSSEPPSLIFLDYKSGIKSAKKLALVGKGITFDSGGISIKPAAKMEEMKYDMAGGAALVGIMYVVSKIKPKIDIMAAVPLAENLPGNNALKPGDVVTAYNGKTIEIINTDAEGRLLLADVLAFIAKSYKPDWIIDLATLTGSIVIALGNKCSGLFGNDQKLLNLLLEAGRKSGEFVWQMPMFDEYKKQLESSIADLKNVGEREAGSITAAKFLEEFVDNISWAHIDIAGTAYNIKDKQYLGNGASGTGVRLIIKLLEKLK
jgi:leucyl aminopeptidase